MSRVDRIVEVKPTAPEVWSLFVTDLGLPMSYIGASPVTVQIRTAASLVNVGASVTLAASPSLDNGLADDVPTFRILPVAASLAAVPAVRARAEILVTIGTGGVRRDFPAVVVP